MTKISQPVNLYQEKASVSGSNLWYKIALKMETILQQTTTASFTNEQSKTSVISKFFNWCEGQDENRFGWLAAALGGHGCFITPITMFAIIMGGNHIFFWALALTAMGATLVTNLAAMPTKITIPIFIVSILIDVAIIASCIAIGLDITKTYI
jgi:hypothetical protein